MSIRLAEQATPAPVADFEKLRQSRAAIVEWSTWRDRLIDELLSGKPAAPPAQLSEPAAFAKDLIPPAEPTP